MEQIIADKTVFCVFTCGVPLPSLPHAAALPALAGRLPAPTAQLSCDWQLCPVNLLLGCHLASYAASYQNKAATVWDRNFRWPPRRSG